MSSESAKPTSVVYGCGPSTIKCLVFFFNFLAFLSGLIISLACIISYFSPVVRRLFLNKLASSPALFSGTPESSASGGLNTLTLLLITGVVVGGVVFLLGFAGCCGALIESPCLLGFFAIAMVLLIGAQVVLGSLAFSYQNEAEDWLWSAINVTAHDAKTSENQTKSCRIYKALADKNICCEMSAIGGGCHFECHGDIKIIPCGEVLWADLKASLKTAGIVLLVLLILEIMATGFACFICVAISRGEKLYENS